MCAQKACFNGYVFILIFYQDEFIAFWRIVYNLFTGMENEAEMYHAAATVSTLLLKLGEVSRKFRTFSVNSSKTELDPIEGTTQSEVSNADCRMPKSQTISADLLENELTSENWSITFEQLIASLLTDNLLVNYFDRKFDLDQVLAEYKSQHA